ncbi:MAG: ACT domain-containing protein [Candidatus Micrarchaeota archaeon]|nr:ACT domain-containing protein [Candidatus Micrarchaeota archaeon]
MGRKSISKIDGKGRLLIPLEHRKELGITDNSKFIIRVSPSKRSLIITPFASSRDRLASIEIEMGDEMGALAKILALLANEKVDLIRTESTSDERGRKARWSAVVDISKCKKTGAELKKLLLDKKLARSVRVSLL